MKIFAFLLLLLSRYPRRPGEATRVCHTDAGDFYR